VLAEIGLSSLEEQGTTIDRRWFWQSCLRTSVSPRRLGQALRAMGFDAPEPGEDFLLPADAQLLNSRREAPLLPAPRQPARWFRRRAATPGPEAGR
jgi:hypothetical protein